MTTLRNHSMFSNDFYSPQATERLKEILGEICTELYSENRDIFLSRLSDFQRDLYQEVVKIPYSSKDFWRDIHDVIVTSHLIRLAVASNEAIPSWLIEAALLHDRGYALLSQLGKRGLSSLLAGDYNDLSGSHWDGVDTRIAHSLYSVEVARYIFDGHANDPKVDALIKECEVAHVTIPRTVLENKVKLLRVIEEHDYPLIGRYGAISAYTQHHFDADSLYSISVTSFVKDYVFYRSDVSKMQVWREAVQGSGIPLTRTFQMKDLFALRLNRYFQEGDSISDVLTPFLRKKGEFGESLFEAKETIPPHSPEARKRTEEAFLRLLALISKLEGVSTEDQFTKVVKDAARAELASI